MTAKLLATNLASTVKLNDGIVMPLFGLGVYQIQGNCKNSISSREKINE